jgi:hypothetical protein
MKDEAERKVVGEIPSEPVIGAVRLPVNRDGASQYIPAEPSYLAPSQGCLKTLADGVVIPDGQPNGSVDLLQRTVAGIPEGGGSIVALGVAEGAAR